MTIADAQACADILKLYSENLGLSMVRKVRKIIFLDYLVSIKTYVLILRVMIDDKR